MNGDSLVNVLVIPYSPVRFLVNRLQCSSSVYIGKTEPREKPDDLLPENLVNGSLKIPLFDLDCFFRKFFKVESIGASHLALIRSFDSFSPAIREKCLEYGMEENTPIAFRVASGTFMSDLKLKSLALWPVTAASFLEERGLLAVSIPPSGGMEYLIDLDILFEGEILPELMSGAAPEEV